MIKIGFFGDLKKKALLQKQIYKEYTKEIKDISFIVTLNNVFALYLKGIYDKLLEDGETELKISYNGKTEILNIMKELKSIDQCLNKQKKIQEKLEPFIKSGKT